MLPTLTYKLDCPLKLARPGGFLMELAIRHVSKVGKTDIRKECKRPTALARQRSSTSGAECGGVTSSKREVSLSCSRRWEVPFIAITFTDNHPLIGFSKLLLTHHDHKD